MAEVRRRDNVQVVRPIREQLEAHRVHVRAVRPPNTLSPMNSVPSAMGKPRKVVALSLLSSKADDAVVLTSHKVDGKDLAHQVFQVVNLDLAAPVELR